MVALKDRFPPSTQDAEWIGKLVGDGDWIIVSGDNRILKNKHEIEAPRQAGHVCFFPSPAWKNLKLWDRFWRLVKLWPVIVNHAEGASRGTLFQLPVQGGEKSKFKKLN